MLVHKHLNIWCLHILGLAPVTQSAGRAALLMKHAFSTSFSLNSAPLSTPSLPGAVGTPLLHLGGPRWHSCGHRARHRDRPAQVSGRAGGSPLGLRRAALSTLSLQIQHQRRGNLENLHFLREAGVCVRPADRARREKHHIHHLWLLQRERPQLADTADQHHGCAG